MNKILSALFSKGGGNGMAKISRDELLKDPRVIEEINRHLWIESEKAGHDIGFDAAADDWMNRFSAGWVKHFLKKPGVKKAGK